MAFDEIEFPLQIESFTSAPEYSTTIIVTGSGAEQRIGNWLDARLTYNAAPGIRSIKDIRILVNFFRARKGALRGFLVKDRLDYEAQGDVFGVGDGAETEFQLLRVYSDAYNADNRPITKPILTTVTIYDDSSPVSEGTEQVETATVLAPAGITTSGDIDIIITAVGMTGSGSPISIAVTTGAETTQNLLAATLRTGLLAESDVTDFFVVSGEDNEIILKARNAAANDGTMNIDLDDTGSTAVGMTDAPTSANTVAGVAGDMAIDYTTGIVSFDTAPATDNVLTWDGEFFTPVRFQDDKLPADEIFEDLTTGDAAGGVPPVLMLEIRDFE